MRIKNTHSFQTSAVSEEKDPNKHDGKKKLTEEFSPLGRNIGTPQCGQLC